MSSQPKNLGELRRSQWSEEDRAAKRPAGTARESALQDGEGRTAFPGVHGYEDTVMPQIINAILSRHHFILLGLRGQAKSRIIRGLISFMDAAVPVVEGCEIHDNPYKPICRPCRERIAERRRRDAHRLAAARQRYVEKLATPGRDHRGHDRRRRPHQGRARADTTSPTS